MSAVAPNRERFVFRILAVLISPGTLDQLQGGFDSTLKPLLALLGGAALSPMDR